MKGQISIKKAVIRIDLEDYINGLRDHPCYIDGTDCFLEASEESIVSEVANIEEAEVEIDRTVYLTINDKEAVIEYEYITESEAIYFNVVDFNGAVYPLDNTMRSEACYEAIKNYLTL